MLSSIAILLSYFILGVLYDIGTTLWYISIESRKVILSGFISACLTLMMYGVLAYIILSPDLISRLIAYALGTWVGTSLTVHFRYNGNYKSISKLFERKK